MGSAVRKGLIPRSLHAAFPLRWSDRIFEPHTRSRLADCAFAGQMSNLLARDASDKWGRGETDFAGSRLGYGTTSTHSLAGVMIQRQSPTNLQPPQSPLSGA